MRERVAKDVDHYESDPTAEVLSADRWDAPCEGNEKEGEKSRAELCWRDS